jgi:hypothetical protein
VIVFLVLVGFVVAVVVTFKRARRRSGSAIVRTYMAEPPAGRLGKLKGERL